MSFNRKTLLGLASVGLGLTATIASADGELQLYNWTDYTSPELIEKFEEETGISVTLDTYDSGETLLAKLQSGAAGYDIAIPTHNFVPILISEGLIQPINASELDGYDRIVPNLASPWWDEGNVYSIPWHWGTTSFTVDTAVYSGNVDDYDVIFNPPEELAGQVAMFKSPDEVITMAQVALGLPFCSEDPNEMQQVLDLLMGQKPDVKTYNSDGILERLVSGDVSAHQNWNGYSLLARKEKPSLQYAFPEEGVVAWADSLVVPKGAPNYDNAITFIEFMLEPENIAIQSNSSGYANGIIGSEAFMAEGLKDAAELSPPEGTSLKFIESCSPKAVELQNRVWTALLK